MTRYFPQKQLVFRANWSYFFKACFLPITCLVPAPCFNDDKKLSMLSCLTINSSALDCASNSFSSAIFNLSEVCLLPSLRSLKISDNFSCLDKGTDPLYCLLKSWMILNKDLHLMYDWLRIWTTKASFSSALCWIRRL